MPVAIEEYSISPPITAPITLNASARVAFARVLKIVAKMIAAKNTGSATMVPPTIHLPTGPSHSSDRMGTAYASRSETTSATNRGWSFPGGQRRTRALASRITTRIEENTSRFTTHVDPNRSDISVTLFVSTSRKPTPMKNITPSSPPCRIPRPAPAPT